MTIEPTAEDFQAAMNRTLLLLSDLRDARELVTNGWCQNVCSRTRWGILGGRHQYCMTGALGQVVIGHLDRGDLVSEDMLDRTDAMITALHQVVFPHVVPRSSGDNAQDLQRWNDRTTTTQADVVDAYDRAIAAARHAR